MTLKGLEALYENEIPKRGEIITEFKEAQNIGLLELLEMMMNITGAATTNGFKGLNGKFEEPFNEI